MEGVNTPERPIQGFVKKDFVSSEAVLGSDVRIEALPDGIRFYLKGKAVDLGQKRITVRLYELMSVEGGLKLRRDPLETFSNRIPEDDEIALKYGPNDVSKGSEGYMWIAKWRDATGEDKGILSETIVISEKWRARYEEAQRKGKAAELPSPGATYAPAPSGPAAFGPMEVLALIEKGEDRALKMMERMAAVMKAGSGEAPASVMERAYEVAGRVVEKSMESNLRMSNKVTAKAEKELERAEEDDEGDGDGQAEAAGGGDGLPAWLAPFLPKIEGWLGSLLGGGPVGAAVKTIIISSDEWKTIFSDKEKFGQAVEAMKQHFGPEQTQKAMDILLNTRTTKKKK